MDLLSTVFFEGVNGALVKAASHAQLEDESVGHSLIDTVSNLDDHGGPTRDNILAQQHSTSRANLRSLVARGLFDDVRDLLALASANSKKVTDSHAKKQTSKY
jgi:hypothetical protein